MNRTFKNHYLIIIISSITLRFILALFFHGYAADINCFKFWAQALFSNGLSNFYSSDFFRDYPPFYMYILYILGAVRAAFDIPYTSEAFTIVIKTPAIVADTATAVFLYMLAAKKAKSNIALCISMFYALNPAVFLDSAIWGQVDSVYTLVIFISIYFLTENRLFKAFFLLTIAILIKPQALIFSPVYLFYLAKTLQKNNFDKKTFLYILRSGVICVLSLVLFTAPFTKDFNFMPIIEQYIKTLASYDYGSVNAYNLYTVLGFNWVPTSFVFLGLPLYIWGTVFIVLIVTASFYLLYRCDSSQNYFFVAAFINFSTFMLSVKMHERYAFSSLLLFLTAYAFNISKKNILAIAIGISVTLFLNCVDVLRLVTNGNILELIQHSSLIISFINVILYIFITAIAIKACKE